jgi:hypothetical protein
VNWVKRMLIRWLGDQPRRTEVVEAEWHRSEELRPDRLGPSTDEVQAWIREDPWRPRNTLG